MTAKFYTCSRKRPCKVAPAGSRYTEDIGLRYDERGNRIFYVKGTIDIYEKIQSYKDDCDIELIIARCLATGDNSFLNRKQGFYADVSKMPKNLAEVYSAVNTAQNIFAQLPHDVASKFAGFEDFISSFGDEERLRKAFDIPKKEESKKTEVKSDA